MYELLLDDYVKEDIKALRKEKKAVLKALEDKLKQLQHKPKSFKELRHQLKGFRKAKFKKHFRIIYSVDDKSKKVSIIAIGTHQNIVYDVVKLRLAKVD